MTSYTITKLNDNSLRYKAKKRGYTLRKSRANMNIDNHGGYMIVDKNNCIAAGMRFDMSIEEVERFVNE